MEVQKLRIVCSPEEIHDTNEESLKKILQLKASLGEEPFYLIQRLSDIENGLEKFTPGRNHIKWQLIKAFISILCTKDTNQAHFDIVREAFHNRPDILENSYKVSLIASELSLVCKKLNKDLINPSFFDSLFKKYCREFRIGNEIPIPALFDFIELDHSDEFENAFKKKSFFLADYIFLKTIKSISSLGRKKAREIEQKLTNSESINFWFNINGNLHLSTALQLICIILENKITSEQDNLNKKNKPEIMRTSSHFADSRLGWNGKIVDPLYFDDEIQKVSEAYELLLHQKSQTTDPQKENFYTGNEQSQEIILANVTLISPKISFTDAEFYKAYYRKENYSGPEMAAADKAQDKFLKSPLKTIYKRQKSNGNYDRIEMESPLAERVEAYVNITQTEDKQIDSGNSEIKRKNRINIVRLHPIFNDQIATKYILKPTDRILRLKKAAGSESNIRPSTRQLELYISRAISVTQKKRPSILAISRDKLIEIMGLVKWVQEGRKSKINDRIDKDINILIKQGMLTHYNIDYNAHGEEKYILLINKKWITDTLGLKK